MEVERDLNKKPNRAKNENKAEYFEWASRTQHILFFLFYLMDYGGLGLHIQESGNSIIDGFHYCPFLILTIILGCPMLFLQTFIGQYTRNGCLFLGEMIPAFSGLGYSMLLISFYKFTKQMFYTAKLVYYLMVSVCNGSPPPWMKCYRNFYKKFPDCFSGKDIDLCPGKSSSDKPCFPPGTRVLSAYIFKELIAFGRIPQENSVTHWLFSKKTFNVIFHFFNQLIIFIFTIFAANKNLKTFYATLRITASFALIALLSILVVVTTKPGAPFGLIVLYTHFKESFNFSKNIWLEYFQNTIEMLRIAEGGHILFGSFIPESYPEFWRAAYLTALFIIVTLAASVYFFLFLGLLYFQLNMDLKLLEMSEENIIFITCPTILGIQASATFFCVSFFFVLSLINFHSLAIKLIVMEKSITVYFNIPDYSFYIRFSFVTLAVLLTYLFTLPEIMKKLFEIKNLFQLYELVSVIFQIVIVLLYGLQRIYDDVEYLTGTRVNVFLSLNWITLPILSSLTFYELYKSWTFVEENKILRIFLISIMSVPFIICFLHKVFSFAKQKNLIGILKPTDLFGPPDIEKRILRILHNPRLEVKYKRQIETCNHDCLLDCNAIQVAIEEEINLISSLAKELKLSSQDADFEKKVITQINKHQNYLLNVIKKQKKKEKAHNHV